MNTVIFVTILVWIHFNFSDMSNGDIERRKWTKLEPGDYVYMRDQGGNDREWTQKGKIVKIKSESNSDSRYAIRVLGSWKIVFKNRQNLRKSMLLGI